MSQIIFFRIYFLVKNATQIFLRDQKNSAKFFFIGSFNSKSWDPVRTSKCPKCTSLKKQYPQKMPNITTVGYYETLWTLTRPKKVGPPGPPTEVWIVPPKNPLSTPQKHLVWALGVIIKPCEPLPGQKKWVPPGPTTEVWFGPTKNPSVPPKNTWYEL